MVCVTNKPVKSSLMVVGAMANSHKSDPAPTPNTQLAGQAHHSPFGMLGTPVGSVPTAPPLPSGPSAVRVIAAHGCMHGKQTGIQMSVLLGMSACTPCKHRYERGALLDNGTDGK